MRVFIGVLGLFLVTPFAGVACVGDNPTAVDASVPDSASPVVDGATLPETSTVKDASVPDTQDATITPYRLFLTSGTHDGAFGPDPTAAAAVANSLCATEAAAGSKTKPIGTRSWRAILAVGRPAKDAIKGTGPWVRPDGAPLGDLRPDATEQPRALMNPPNLDANGKLVADARVWIGGYTFIGLPLYPDCTFFSKTGNGATYDIAAATADPSAVTAAWAKDTAQGYVRACQEQHHVYCVEEDK
jgi:hypothetical protein